MIAEMLQTAARIAISKNHEDRRHFRLGAIALTRDGRTVHAKNGSSYDKYPKAHAEARLLKKSGSGCAVFVARITREGLWALAKPCAHCAKSLCKAGVTKVYYTISPGVFGVMHISKK